MGTAYLPSPLHKIAYYFFDLTVPTSDFMFFLDVEPHEAFRRIQLARERQEMFENLGELEQIRRQALYLAVAGNWKIIDANRSITEVESEIRNRCFRQNS